MSEIRSPESIPPTNYLRWFVGLWLYASVFYGCYQWIQNPHDSFWGLAIHSLYAPLKLILGPLYLGIVFEEWDQAFFVYGGIILSLATYKIVRAIRTYAKNSS